MRPLRSIACVFATCVAACGPSPSPAVTMAPASEPVEAVSLLGDSLRRPSLDAAARARMDAQLDSARRIATAAPSDPEALIWVGRRIAYLGRYGDAITTFSDGVRRFPNDARFLRHRGHRYISIRRFDDAIADLERAATLMRNDPDQVEPDGQPNARNIPIGSLQSNVWYHLALAYYLKGDWSSAVRAATAGIGVSSNPDRLVSQTHWLYMALRRAGRTAEASAALAPIRDDFDIIENDSYYQLLRMYKGSVSPAQIDSAIAGGVRTPGAASIAYGLGNWYLYSGDTTRAVSVYESILRGGSWASFGYIAAEADLARIRRAR